MSEEEEFGWLLGVVLLMDVVKEDDVGFGMIWDEGNSLVAVDRIRNRFWRLESSNGEWWSWLFVGWSVLSLCLR